MNRAAIALYAGLWAGVAAQVIRRIDAQRVHHALIGSIRPLDAATPIVLAARAAARQTLADAPVTVGGVTLPIPIILAAGFVKGDGFADESDALRAVDRGVNIIPGWRIMPALVGPVEFGSFTRWPRLGNPGRVLWRDDATQSTQNRIGLRNPGARAAAAFLGARRAHLPPVWGVNLAPTPGVGNTDQEASDLLECADLFMRAFPVGSVGRPSWITLNLSCPNTEDDPGAHQTAATARDLCRALSAAIDLPLWVKLSPGLSGEQYTALVRACADNGARALIATNTLGQPTPDGSAIAGVGGGRLRDSARAALADLHTAARTSGAAIDLIACGGILNGHDFQTVCTSGARAAMIYSALVFRGPLAAALILNEASQRTQT